MANHLPIDGEQVRLAAEEAIAQHGNSAVVEVGASVARGRGCIHGSSGLES